ncbi:MAG: aspartate/glutamate racemase family protein [Candidatus Eisenbacteria bacterium]
MNTIGILGGLGPQATIHFQQLVLEVSQRLLPRNMNLGYPPMVVHFHRGSPMAMDDSGKLLVPPQPAPSLLETARRIGRDANILVFVSNGVHLFARDLEAASGIPVLNLIDLVLAEVRQRGWKKVGVLTYYDPRIYEQPVRESGLEPETLGKDLQAPLDAGIEAVIEGRAGADHAANAQRALSALRARQVDGTILGCTEIPFLLDERARPDSPDLIDPLPLLAEAAVRRAAHS